MLQNRCKGIYFSRNNQKKTQKNHKLATFSLFGLGRTWNREASIP